MKHFFHLSVVIWFFLGLAPVVSATPDDHVDDHVDGRSADIFDLSLVELASIKVTGAAIRSLHLSLIPDTNNPHQLTVHSYASSVDVVDSKTIEARGLKNVVEVVESMVGILSGESPSEPYSFSTRGFTRNAVTVLYDGISLGLSTLNMRPLNTFNLERVEVVKGASTVMAPTTSGGTVNIINKKPVLSRVPINDVLVRSGEFNSHSMDLAINAPINESSAYRVDINHSQSDGWVDRSDSQSLNTKMALLVKPSKAMDVNVSFNYLEDELPAYWGTPLVPQGSAQSPNSSVVDTDQDLVIDNNTRFNNYNVADNAITSSSLWSRLDLHWHLSADTVINANAYSYQADRLWKNAESYAFDVIDQQINRDRFFVKHERYVRGFKLGVTNNFNYSNHHHSLALSFESNLNDFKRDLGYSSDVDNVNLINPVAGNFGLVEMKVDKQTHIVDAWSVQLRSTFFERLSFELGIRTEQVLFDRLRLDLNNSIVPGSVLDTSLTQNSGRISGLLTLTPFHSVYAQYSQTHDPIEDDIKFIYDLANYDESDVNSWELGIKSVFNGNKTESSLAVYGIKKTSLFQSDSDIGTNEQNSQGLEFAVKHTLTDQVRLGGNLAYTDAQYGDFYDSEADLGSGAYVNNKVPVNVPEVMLSSWLSVNNIFHLPIEIGGGVNYVSKRFANSVNTLSLKPYTLMNVFAAYQQDNYRISLNIRNAMDEIYAPWSDVYYPNQVALGSPRSIDINFRARF